MKNPAILGAAAAIASVESGHAAVLADLAGGNPFPAPPLRNFDDMEKPKTKAEMLAAVKPFVK